MEDKQLRILFLTKLYEHNRNGASVHNLEQNAIFDGVDSNQMNFCLQYLGTLNLIQTSYRHGGGLTRFTPEVITGKGIDIVESLVSEIKIKNEIFEKASSVIERIPIFLNEVLTNQELLNAIIAIFDRLIEALKIIF